MFEPMVNKGDLFGYVLWILYYNVTIYSLLCLANNITKFIIHDAIIRDFLTNFISKFERI